MVAGSELPDWRQMPIIGVIGGSVVDEKAVAAAREVGRRIAQAGALLICGGLGGVMQAACEGAVKAGGTTVGVLPGNDPRVANPFVTIPIATGLDIARNLIIVRTSDVLIAIAGGYGTLNEIAAALNLGKPVVALQTWDLPAAGQKVDPDLFFPVQTAQEAVEKAIALAAGRRR